MKKVSWKKITQFKGPEHSPGFLLWRVSTQWRRQIEAALAQVELTHPQFVLLANIGWLTRNKEKISQVGLARHCGTDINMTSQVLRALEKKGLIQRKQRKGDERSKFPTLTSSGAQLIEKAIPLVESVDEAFFKNLESEVVEVLSKIHKVT